MNAALYIFEGLTALCIIGIILYYRKVVRPLKHIYRGMDLLKEQDFSSRLTPTGVAAADRVGSMFNDMMTSLKNERLRVREQNQLLDLLIEASPLGIIMLDGNYNISMINRVAARLTGVDEKAAIGMKWETMTGYVADTLKRLANGESDTLRLDDLEIYRCTRLSFINNGYPHPFFIIEEMTGEIRDAERSTYERIIRIIAHEVNNSVAGVNSTLETVSDFLPSDGTASDMADVIEISRNRLMAMSRFITRFSDLIKMPDACCRQEPIDKMLRDCTAIVSATAAVNNITIDNRCEGLGITLPIDRQLMDQAIINILKNAIESIGSDGTVTIDFDIQGNALNITDNGAGISAEAQRQLFTPMFTTKPNGHGLGLLLTAEILRKHGCTFSLRTDHTDGLTRFRITFPRNGD